MSVASWTAIHNAVRSAIVLASGLPDGKVIWDYGNADAPQRPYISLAFGSLLTKGQDYLLADFDELRPPGSEYRFTTSGTREMALEMACFTDSTADSNDAQALLDLTKTSLLLPDVRELMNSVSVSPFDPGPIGYVPEIVNGLFRGRATCTVRCYVPAPAAMAFAGYIETVQGTITVHGAAVDPLLWPFSVP